ncbi:restriction endonuclease subunit S [Gluconobacter cerinus]
MSNKGKSSAEAGSGAALVSKLRFPEFQELADWETAPGNELFQQVSNRKATPGLPILAITQEHGAIPRHMIDYHVSVTEKSLETYKEVMPGDFIISLRSFQGGIEFSDYHGICSPAYVILRKRGRLSDSFYRQYFKSPDFIQQLTRNLEGLRDGKMISYKQFSGLQLLKPSLPEQQKIAACMDSVDALIAAQGQMVETLRSHKKGLMQQLFPQEDETQPRLRFPEFEGKRSWKERKLSQIVEVCSGQVDPTELPYCDMPHIGGENIESDNVRLEPGKSALELGLISGKYIFDGGHVLYSKIRPALSKVALPDFEGICSAEIYPIRPTSGRLSRFFLAYLLLSNAFLKYATRHSDRSKIPKVNRESLLAYETGIPSLREQERIADCLTSLDDLIAAETRKLDSLNTHKKGLMQQLFPRGGEVDA